MKRNVPPINFLDNNMGKKKIGVSKASVSIIRRDKTYFCLSGWENIDQEKGTFRNSA